jgi:hypothetical protein
VNNQALWLIEIAQLSGSAMIEPAGPALAKQCALPAVLASRGWQPALAATGASPP